MLPTTALRAQEHGLLIEASSVWSHNHYVLLSLNFLVAGPGSLLREELCRFDIHGTSDHLDVSVVLLVGWSQIFLAWGLAWDQGMKNWVGSSLRCWLRQWRLNLMRSKCFWELRCLVFLWWLYRLCRDMVSTIFWGTTLSIVVIFGTI